MNAAELIINTQNPYEAYAKAKALQSLFPERLKEDFVESFNPEDFAGPSAITKMEFIKLAAEYSANKQEIIELWKAVFPGDKWVPDLVDGKYNPSLSETTADSASWGVIAQKLQQNENFINELQAQPGFQEFINTLVTNDVVLKMLASDEQFIRELYQQELIIPPQ